MCLKHQFLSKYSIIFAKVAGCFVPRGVDRKYITVAIFVYLASWILKTAPRARLEPAYAYVGAFFRPGTSLRTLSREVKTWER